jgi:hypothetical protein
MIFVTQMIFGHAITLAEKTDVIKMVTSFGSKNAAPTHPTPLSVTTTHSGKKVRKRHFYNHIMPHIAHMVYDYATVFVREQTCTHTHTDTHS